MTRLKVYYDWGIIAIDYEPPNAARVERKTHITCVGSEHCSEHCLFRTSVPNTVSEPLWRSLWSLYKVFISSPPRGGGASPSLPSGSFWRPYKDFIKTFKGAQRQCSEQMFGTDSVRNRPLANPLEAPLRAPWRVSWPQGPSSGQQLDCRAPLKGLYKSLRTKNH